MRDYRSRAGLGENVEINRHVGNKTRINIYAV